MAVAQKKRIPAEKEYHALADTKHLHAATKCILAKSFSFLVVSLSYLAKSFSYLVVSLSYLTKTFSLGKIASKLRGAFA